MIIREPQDVEELDIEKVIGVKGAQTKVRWLISSEVGGEEYGHQFAMRHFVMQPGGYYPVHSHHYVEGVFMVSGELEFAGDDGVWHVIQPGSVVYTYRGEDHELRNRGTEPAAFLCCIDCDPNGEGCVPPRPPRE